MKIEDGKIKCAGDPESFGFAQDKLCEESKPCILAYTPGSAFKLTPIPRTPACQVLTWQRSA